MRPRANVPRVPTQDAKGHRAVAALSTPSGQMAGVGRDCGGLPRTQRTQTQPAGRLAAHRAGGSEALASGGLERPLPVRTAPGSIATRFSGGACPLILPEERAQHAYPSRIILERINYEIVN